MIVQLRFFGPFTQYTGHAPLAIDVPEDARLQDVVEYIADQWGGVFPPQLWDQQNRRFQTGVLLLLDQHPINQEQESELHRPLTDGMTLMVLYTVMGG
ncbi:hypothetical protein GF339_07970 [candidate division KSB3 bacterium]|uniref:MoaD/ThiS family protein n=1 Tax=candidate division KSB3 bacterium TaxID=2044937 RepID=A0A9D5JVL3_9BACT|nr:hypothetical protein [candidate division KSB3 bacterium]MBD3324506.1 hypothetical protein [candidate division KSB3 bacterium]